MNKKITLSAYAAAALPMGVTPSSGSRTSGSRLVAASGNASVIHQSAINTQIEATVRPAGESPLASPGNPKYIAAAASGPSNSPILRTDVALSVRAESFGFAAEVIFRQRLGRPSHSKWEAAFRRIEAKTFHNYWI
jgi:hypothetical protein